jgi:hypothetical protein
LLEHLENAKRWQAHLFWRLKSIPNACMENTPNNGSLMMVEYDCDAALNVPDPLYAAIKPRHARFGAGLIATLLTIQPNIAKRLLEYALEDWGGESRFLVAILGLLNTRNVVQTETVDMELTNKKRERSGKRPLFSHDLIKVRPFITASGERATEGGHRDLRLHFVRGHFKHRRTGLFWWSMHARGDAKVGVTLKDYEIEGE